MRLENHCVDDGPSGNNPSVLPDTYAIANLGRVLLQALSRSIYGTFTKR